MWSTNDAPVYTWEMAFLIGVLCKGCEDRLGGGVGWKSWSKQYAWASPCCASFLVLLAPVVALVAEQHDGVVPKSCSKHLGAFQQCCVLDSLAPEVKPVQLM
jgi:hypothetical protein